jgi:ARC6-like, IMS domain
MANIDSLIPKLDQKLKSLHQEKTLIAKTGKTSLLEQPLLPEYLRLTTTDGISPGIQLIVMDTLSNHFSLYEDGRERQQLLAAIADELNDSADSDILASIQIIQNVYPSIYMLGQEQLSLTRERAINTITGFFPPAQPTAIPTNASPVVSQTTTIPTTRFDSSSPVTTIPVSQNKSGLMMGVGIISAVIVGAAISNGFNKVSTTNVSVTPPPSPVAPSMSGNAPSAPPTSNISREAAVDVVKQWLQYKRVLFAPPYDKSQGSTILTDKAYRNNIDRSSEPCNSSDQEGCLSSVDWLRKYDGQYSFGVQRVDSIDNFEASGDSATIFVTVTEYRTLHQRGSSKPSGGTKKARYDLKYENGRVKISDYKVF